MRVPSVAVEPCDILSYRDGRPPVQRRMGPMRIVEVLEGHQFVCQVRRRPEQQLIHAFSSQRADQPFDKRMRQLYCPRVLGQWFDGIRFYAAASSPTRSRRTWAGLR